MVLYSIARSGCRLTRVSQVGSPYYVAVSSPPIFVLLLSLAKPAEFLRWELWVMVGDHSQELRSVLMESAYRDAPEIF